MEGTSVTVVLIGAETAGRPWVQYEITQSWNRGNGVVGVSIHNVKDCDRKTDVAGCNPFDQFRLPDGTLLSSICKTYDWVHEDGRSSLGAWIEDAYNARSMHGMGDLISASEVHKQAQLPSVVRNFAAPAPPYRPVPVHRGHPIGAAK
jgi:hypothetical protein